MSRLLARTARVATTFAVAAAVLVGGAATAGAGTPVSAAAPAAMAMSTVDYSGSRSGAAQEVVLDGVRHRLVKGERPQSNYVRYAYLPAGQTMPTYERMVLVEAVTGASVSDALRDQVEMLQRRKATDPLVNMDVRVNHRTGEMLLDFTMSGRAADGRPIVEWNAYRYLPVSQHGVQGVQLFGLSLRAYDDDRLGFARNLTQIRQREIPAVSAARVTRVELPGW